MPDITHWILADYGPDCDWVGQLTPDDWHITGEGQVLDRCGREAPYQATSTVGQVARLCTIHAAHVRQCAECNHWLDSIRSA